MKQIKYLFVFMVMFIVPLYAQLDTLVLEDYAHNGNLYLNAQLNADSTSTAFTSGTRIYILRKDGIYLFNALYGTSQGKPVRIAVRSWDPGYNGFGLQPQIYGVLSAANALPGNFIDMRNGGLVELSDLNVSNYYCGDAGGSDSLIHYQQGGLVRIGNVGGTGRIKINNCVLHGPNGNHIRTDGTVDTIIVTNTIFSDMGNIRPSNFGAGKALDLRDVGVEYCRIQNCTFVNAQDRTIRHYNSKQPIKNFIFDHNTVINNMSYHGFLSLGKVDSTGTGILKITNNLLVDHFALGADTAYLRQAEFSDPKELDPLNNQYRMSWVMTNKNDAAVWDIQKNYYAYSDSGAVLRNLSAADGYIPRAYTGNDPYLTFNMNALLNTQAKDTLNTFTKINIVPVSVPTLMTQMIRWVYTPRTTAMTISGRYINPKYTPTVSVDQVYSLNTSGDGKQKNSGDANYTATKILTGIYGLDYNRNSLNWYGYWPYYNVLGAGKALNCNFYASQNLSAAGTDGLVIGDTRWSYLGPTSADNAANQLPDKFSLDQNYPNPFNPTTTIQYSIPTASHVTLKIVNILGQVVATLVDEKQEAKSYTKEFDASRLSSGVYFYQINAGTFSATKKMILMK